MRDQDPVRLPMRREAEQAAAQKVDIGRGHLGVTIAMERSGKPYVKRMAVAHPENVSVKAGVDKSGRRYWRSGPVP